MEVRTAVTFLRVAELQSFSRAAQQLGYSQAAVTVQIKQLEQELGTQLFERIGRRTKLTEHGAQFVPRAMELVEAARKAENFLQDQGRAAGSLRIGTAESLFMSTLVPLLPEFHRLCPLVEICLMIFSRFSNCRIFFLLSSISAVNSSRVFSLGFVMGGRSFLLMGKRKEQPFSVRK